MEFKDLLGIGVRVYENGDIIDIARDKKLTHTKDQYGYPRVYFKNASGKRRGYFVHRLLGLAFIPNPENKPYINHKDGVKDNFSLNNLEWVTPKENMTHAYGSGLMANVIKANEKRIQKTRNRAVMILKNNGFTHFEIASILGCSQVNITRLIKRKCNSLDTAGL